MSVGTVLRHLYENEARDSTAVAFTMLDGNGQIQASLTNGELSAQVRSMAAAVAARVPPGEPVLITVPFSLDYVVAVLGVFQAGAIAVPLFPPTGRQKRERLAAIASDSSARFAVVGSETPAHLLASRELVIPGCTVEAIAVPSGHVPSEVPDRAHHEGVALVQYTSGSTRTPRGVVIKHRHLLENLDAIRKGFAQTHESIVVGWTPLFHDMGLIGTVLQTIFTGSRCILIRPADFISRPALWLEAISAFRATTSGGPSFGYGLCTTRAQATERLDLSSWTVAFCGAERIRPETLEAFGRRFHVAGFRASSFVPCYGLAEATLLVTAEIIGSGLSTFSTGSTRVASCGVPPAGTSVRIVDPHAGNEQREGHVGEIWVTGPSVADGYWHQPRGGDGVFVSAPSDVNTTVRTGDLGFVRDGRLYFTGRLKDVIVLQGVNCAADDIEAAVLASHPAVRHAAVAAFPLREKADEALGIAVELPRDDEAAHVVRAIRRAVRREFQIDPGWIGLVRPGRLPRTTSGKIQRSACVRAYAEGAFHAHYAWASAEADDFHPASGDPLIDDVASVVGWAVHTDVDEESLVDLGLDSRGAFELALRLLNRTGVSLQAEALLAGTVGDLRRRVSAGSPQTSVRQGRAPGAESVLSPGQEGLWFQQQIRPRDAPLQIVRVFAVRDASDVDEFERAWQVVIERHRMLRARFFQTADGPRQRIAQVGSRTWFRRIDSPARTADELWADLLRYGHEPLDVATGPLVRVIVVRWRNTQFLCLTLHHLVTDVWSARVIADDVASVVAGRELKDPADAPSYFDYVAWAREWLGSADGDRALGFWREFLRASASCVRQDARSSAVRTSTHRVWVDAATVSILERLASEERTSIASVLLAAFARLLAWRGGERHLVAMPVHARPAEMRAVVGYCTNLMLLPVCVQGDDTFRGSVRRVASLLADAYPRSMFPLNEIVRRGVLPRVPGRPMVARHVFAYQGQGLADDGLAGAIVIVPGECVQIGDTRLTMMGIEEPQSDWDTGLWAVRDGNGCLHMKLQWRGVPDEAVAAARTLERIISGAREDPDGDPVLSFAEVL